MDENESLVTMRRQNISNNNDEENSILNPKKLNIKRQNASKYLVDEKLSMRASFFRVLIFVLYKLITVLYVPVFIFRIFKKKKVVPPVNDEILCLKASELTEKILNKEISCEEALRRYIARIEEVNPLLNAVVNDRFSSAIEDAKNLDKFLSATTSPTEELRGTYPLLGVPLTVKGSLAVQGLPHTSGMIKRSSLIATEDAVAVGRARSAGAVPLLTSNTPELCLSWETTNKLVGTTRNPYDTTRTVGGSSGGEAALMGAGASLIGIGSDIAGSLRLPPHFCGTYGHKPSPGAVSYEGHYPGCKKDKEWTAFFTVGPMARYAVDLRVLLGVIIKEEWKGKLRLDEEVKIGSIKVYYMEDMDCLLASTFNMDTKNAYGKVVKHLSRVSRQECKKIDLPLIKHGAELASLQLIDIDEVDNLFEGNGEGSVSELMKFLVGRSDSILNAILYGVLRKVYSWSSRNNIHKGVNEKINYLREQFLEILDENSVFVLPAFPAQAHEHGDVYRKIFDAGYMMIFNAMGFPVTCGPVAYSKDKLPIGIQVVARPDCDRLTLAVTEELERAFGGWHSPSTIT